MDFLGTLKNSGIVMFYDAYKSGESVPVFVSAGVYGNLIKQFTQAQQDVYTIASNNLTLRYQKENNIMNFKTKVNEFTKDNILAYTPLGISSTSYHEEWIWIHFSSLQNMLDSQIHIDHMHLLDHIIFQNYGEE